MLPRKHRLSFQDGPSAVYKRLKQSRRGKYLLIRYGKNDAGHSRIAVVISRQAISVSAHRNRIRRILFEAIRQRRDFLFSGSCDIVVQLQNIPHAVDKKLEAAIVDELNTLLKETEENCSQ